MKPFKGSKIFMTIFPDKPVCVKVSSRMILWSCDGTHRERGREEGDTSIWEVSIVEDADRKGQSKERSNVTIGRSSIASIRHDEIKEP